jgi:hypothetical protein
MNLILFALLNFTAIVTVLYLAVYHNALAKISDEYIKEHEKGTYEYLMNLILFTHYTNVSVMLAELCKILILLEGVLVTLVIILNMSL